MCVAFCGRCLGVILNLFSIVACLANVLLFFPGGKQLQYHQISDEVWLFGGIVGSGIVMLFSAKMLSDLGYEDCCGCCGNESCGKRFAMCSSIIFAVIGLLGSGYSFLVSVIAIKNGPKCLMDNHVWGYPFHNGDYLENKSLWKKCLEPEDVVPWNLILFCILLVIAVVQMLVCIVQVVKGLLGVLFGDCRCCSGRCGVSGDLGPYFSGAAGRDWPPALTEDTGEGAATESGAGRRGSADSPFRHPGKQ
ncbi:transmembrane 4 L6 family member 4-like [Saccopteryx leptura]|uniref:transmembrane 4 L6 family member 4-like n=1 Tax=Saccopteryx leptura TaxID=249018 RepID=UPI00339C50D8